MAFVSKTPCPNCELLNDGDASVCPGCGELLGATMFFPVPTPKGTGMELDLSEEPEEFAPLQPFACFLESPAFQRPLRLSKGEIYRVGRGRSCEITLPSGHVSRLHSEVVFENGAWVIGDLGSRNGTYVNGKRVFRQRLRHDDRISVGQYDLSFQEYSEAETYALLKESKETTFADTAPIRTDPGGLFGDLAKMPVVEVVQLVQKNRKTGCLMVTRLNSSGPPARLFFRKGAIIHADDGKEEGDQAALAIMRTRRGTFSFLAHQRPKHESVSTPTSSLLLGAMAG